MPEPRFIDASVMGWTPTNRPYWTAPETPRLNGNQERPLHYSNGVVASAFFGRSTIWLKLILWMREDTRDLLGIIDPPRSATGRIQWRLYDIERLAYGLLDREVITLQHWILVLGVIKHVAVMNSIDVGDPRLMQPLDENAPPDRQKAFALVHERLAEQDRGQEAPEPENGQEHLVAHAAWAMRKLEEHLEGLR